MVNIASVINKGLANNETFYLPGLGMFRSEYVPAYFDEVKQLFNPPSETLFFNTQEFDSDKLTEFIAGNYDLSLLDARKISSNILSKLETCLGKKDEVYIEGLGTCSVSLNEELRIAAEVDSSQFDLYDPIAEAEILLPTPEKPDAIDEHGTALDNEELADPAESLVEPVEYEQLDAMTQEGDSKRWLWPVIGVAAAIIIAGVWFLKPLQKPINNSVNTENEMVENQSQEIPTDSVASATEISENTELNADSINTLSPNASGGEVNAVVRKPTKKYELIIAAFETMAEAKEFVEKTNAKGYNVYILQNNRAGNMNKISYASFNTSAEASASLARVRDELTSEAWLWENKNYITNNKN